MKKLVQQKSDSSDDEDGEDMIRMDKGAEEEEKEERQTEDQGSLKLVSRVNSGVSFYEHFSSKSFSDSRVAAKELFGLFIHSIDPETFFRYVLVST